MHTHKHTRYPITAPLRIISYSLADCTIVELRWTDTYSTTCGGPSYARGRYDCGEDGSLTARSGIFNCVDPKPNEESKQFFQDFKLDAEYGIVLGKDGLAPGDNHDIVKPEYWYYKVSN